MGLGACALIGAYPLLPGKAGWILIVSAVIIYGLGRGLDYYFRLVSNHDRRQQLK